MIRAVVTGANRGIGLELVRQLAARGDQVEACVRTAGAATALAALAGAQVRIHTVDVTAPTTVASLARSLGDGAVDTVFNVAGVFGEDDAVDTLAGDLSLGDAARTYDVDALGALRVSLALLPHLRRGQGKKLVHISSVLASIADNSSGGYYGYRMAKAALNMMSRSLAVDLRADGIASYVMDPGWVQTDMGGPSAPTPVADSVRGILREVDHAGLGDSGEFLCWKGGRTIW